MGVASADPGEAPLRERLLAVGRLAPQHDDPCNAYKCWGRGHSWPIALIRSQIAPSGTNVRGSSRVDADEQEAH